MLERLVSPSVSTLGFFILKKNIPAQAAIEAAAVRRMNKTNITCGYSLWRALGAVEDVREGSLSER